jgi:hypothetical protein
MESTTIFSTKHLTELLGIVKKIEEQNVERDERDRKRDKTIKEIHSMLASLIQIKPYNNNGIETSATIIGKKSEQDFIRIIENDLINNGRINLLANNCHLDKIFEYIRLIYLLQFHVKLALKKLELIILTYRNLFLPPNDRNESLETYESINYLTILIHTFKEFKIDLKHKVTEENQVQLRRRFSKFLGLCAEATGYFNKTQDPKVAETIFDVQPGVLLEHCGIAVAQYLFCGQKNYTYEDENNDKKTLELISSQG